MKTTATGLSVLASLPLLLGAQAAQAESFGQTYADIAQAKYEDSLASARGLQSAIQALIASPSEQTLADARAAWVEARVPYQQSEVYRFGNAVVDDWEGKVNAWPLDEGLIDYVDASYGTESDGNALYAANVVANPEVKIGGKAIDAAAITPALLQDTLHEAAGNEANVATGYHAIEFLLWGQDLNGTAAGAGARPHTDFDTANCSNGHCERRAQYLQAATDLLIADLEEMVAQWQADGAARQGLQSADDASVFATALTGMGSLSYGELAGERMRLGLMLHDPEEEHDCFSDNTHFSHFYDAKGIQNIYLGEYARPDGELLKGVGLAEKVAAVDAELDKEMQRDLAATMAAMQAMVDRAEGGEAYDQMIGEGNAEGNAVVQAAVDALVKQTKTIERIVVALGAGAVTIEGSDSLDNPDAVFE